MKKVEITDQFRRNKIRRNGTLINGLAAAGIGSLAVIGGVSGNYNVAVPEAAAAAGIAYEAYRNLRYGEHDGRGYLVALFGGIFGLPGVVSFSLSEGRNAIEGSYERIVGTYAVAHPGINAAITLHRNLSK